MKSLLILILFLAGSISPLLAQVKFIERFEVLEEPNDPTFEMMRIEDGLVSFRTYQGKGFSAKKVFQFFVSDLDLKSKGLIELEMRPGYEMVGYDTDGNNLFVLMAKGYASTSDKYILQVNLESNQGFEFPAENLLSIELVEFLVQNRKAVFMGSSEGRPVLQIFDLDTKSIHTVQGVYGNNTQVLQIREMPELEALEVVISRRGQYKDRETSILTFDMLGNLVREIKVDKFGTQDQEILDGMLLADQNYQQVMIGSYGLNGRAAYQGMYIMEINEFGEYDFKLYTLEDFPNFFNYLSEKQKSKRDEVVVKELEKSKIPLIRNTYAVRDVRQQGDAYYIYFDQVNIVSNGGRRPNGWTSTSNYRYDRINRMGYAPYYMDPFLSPSTNPMQTFTAVNEYQYESAHFLKVSKEGNVLWDNAATYGGFITTYPEPFGEIAIVGDDLYHLYAENDLIKASFFRNGEKVFENLDFELELPNENERIDYTDFETLRLVHWYDRYFILTGQQTVRGLNPQNQTQERRVFFMSKILVDGDLYQSEEAGD
ncbi:transcriptional regulator [Algoriphagus aestuariicola]|uniref:Transcriptional regulator n=1 Tax=Algoriphagus aestuariicola TaxID=1852016 RepID=A0ABS3BJW8_9BACT|nr:transcriptional regulator [Algoriphagus aestuariicola]MBN7799602.1 transcriptional regulator [Algoriphagus aestuariicola]